MKVNQTEIKQGIKLKDIGYAIPFTFVNNKERAALREGVFMKVSPHQEGFLSDLCIYIVNLITGVLYVVDVDCENYNPIFCDCDEVIPHPNSILNLQR